MKTGSVLVVMAIVLAILGAALSYSGYGESLTLTTLTNVESYTTTSTQVVPTMSTDTTVFRTSSLLSILQTEIDLEGTGKHGGAAKYCGIYTENVYVTLDAGEVHVSYNSEGGSHAEGGKVDFWMLNERQLKDWRQVSSCSGLHSYKGTAARIGSNTYEFTTNIPSSGLYYFVFLNENVGTVSITLSVDAGMQESNITETRVRTLFSTIVSPLLTETVTLETHPIGLGLLFYAGIGLIGAAAIALVMSRTKNVVPKAAPLASAPVVPTSPVVSTPLARTAGKFCISCGAPLPAHATFCNKCGSKQ